MEGLKRLLSQGSLGLFLDPGLGKTSLVLAAIKILKAKGLISRTLIIAPIRPMYKVWPDEIAKWADFNHLTYAILHDNIKEHNIDSDADIHIINPEGLKWFLSHPKKVKYDLLVIDESTKFKSYASQRFKMLKGFLPQFTRRWILTGTPSPNGLMDLFPQVYILDLGRALGRFITHFRRDFFDQTTWNIYEYTPKPGAFERIMEKMSPLVYQLSAEDHLAMPALVYKTLTVELPEKAMLFYRRLEDHFLATWGSVEFTAGSEAVLSGKLHQIANGAIYHDQSKEFSIIHDEKLDALESYLEELSGKPTLVIYEYNHDLVRIQSRFGNKIPNLGSGVSREKIEKMVDDFNEGRIPILLGHPAAMGHGLNLQGACHHMIWFSVPWDLEYYDQTIARIYRQGQKSDTVFIYHIVSDKTKDDDIVEVLAVKDKSQQTLLRALR